MLQKMINFADVTKENIKEHNTNWPQTLDHPYRIWIIGGSTSGKTNSLFNLISQLLIKYIYMLKIRAKENIKSELTKGKV